jgi:hypothetical protein
VKNPGFSVFFPEEIHRRTCVVVAARGRGAGGRGRGRQSPTTPPEVSPEPERKSRTLSPSNTRCPVDTRRGYDSVPKPIPSTFGHHLFAKGSRTGTPPRGRPPDHRSRGDPAVSRAEADILSTYMRGARDQQRGYTFGTPFRRVTTQETPENVEKCPLFDELIVGSAIWYKPALTFKGSQTVENIDKLRPISDFPSDDRLIS